MRFIVIINLQQYPLSAETSLALLSVTLTQPPLQLLGGMYVPDSQVPAPLLPVQRWMVPLAATRETRAARMKVSCILDRD